MDREKLWRIWEIGKRLERGEYLSTASLTQKYEIGPRTVYRDIQDLSNIYAMPITYCRKRRAYYCNDKNFKFHAPLKLTEGELLVLYLGHNLLSQCAGTILEDSIKSAFSSIISLLPREVSIDDASLLESFSLDLPPLRAEGVREAKHSSSLSQAVAEKQTCSIRYYTAGRGKESQRLVDPYKLYYHDGVWYLIAYCHNRKSIRIFALDRILALEVTEKHFTDIQGFNINDYLSESFGGFSDEHVYDIAIRFNAAQAYWVSGRCWHHTQEIEEQLDGSIILRMRVSGLLGVKRWVMRYGCYAEVLAPEELRRMVCEEVEGMKGVYSKELK
ncbi:MAG: WYL domain-containing protein [bacterium]|nr:WYL domain-containing protein [bacterium]